MVIPHRIAAGHVHIYTKGLEKKTASTSVARLIAIVQDSEN